MHQAFVTNKLSIVSCLHCEDNFSKLKDNNLESTMSPTLYALDAAVG